MNGVVALDGQQEDGEQEEYDTYEEGNEGVAQATMPPDLGAYHGKGVGQDEAFSRAMNAMYWTGYWTAVYHVSENYLCCLLQARALGDVEEDVAKCSGALYRKPVVELHWWHAC